MITYWTTAPLEPAYEAVSKEVFDLADHFGGRIVSVSAHLRLTMQRGGRVLGFHHSWDPFMRLVIPLLERMTTVNHVYAEISPWLYHRTLRRRPTILTIASEKGTVLPGFLQQCAYVTVQTQRMRQQLLDLGVQAHQCRLIYPGIDLSRFAAAGRPAPGARTRIVFATFPRTAEELASRGVNFLLDICEAFPDIDLTVVSRPWKTGCTALAAVRADIARRRLTNVEILEGVQASMDEVYRRADFCIIPYTTPDGGKECPRSLVESMACGVPVLISEVAPFAPFVERQQCGRAFALEAESFGAQLAAARATYGHLRDRAVASAHANFDVAATLRAYASLYADLERERAVAAGAPGERARS